MLDTECANHARLWNGEAASATVMEFWRGFPPRFITEPPNLVKSRPETVASLTLRFPVCYLFSIFRGKKSALRCYSIDASDEGAVWSLRLVSRRQRASGMAAV